MSAHNDPTATNPSTYNMAAEEDIVLTFDATALLVSGSAPTSPVATITDITSGEAVSSVDAATVLGNSIKQRVRGLSQGREYRLRLTFMTSGNRRAMTLYLHVV